MKIILWGINYRPEATGIAPFNAELAEYLASRDCDTSVVTGFAYYPQWQKTAADRARLYRSETINGVRVHRCGLYVPGRVTTLRRIFHELSFGLTSLLRVLALPRADLYVVVSPPLILGFCAWIATRLKRSRYLFHVQDLQPGAAVGLGMVKSRGFIRLLYALEALAYRHAAAVSGISDGMMAEFARKDIPAPRRVYFPNWLRHRSAPASESGSFRRQFGVPAHHLLAVYSGNLGRKQGINILLAAAERLADAPITLIIAGAGAEREALAAHLATRRRSRLRLLPLLSDIDYARMLTDADVGLITQASGTGQCFFPSKLLSLLQARRPVVTVADEDSELARAVASGGFGLNVPPERPEDLAGALRQLSERPDVLRRLRENTRWVERFASERVLPQLLRQLSGLVSEDVRPPLVTQPEISRP